MTSTCGAGEGWASPAIRPAMCATSAASTAPTSSAIAANPAKSIVRGIAVPPHQISFGSLAQRELAHLVEVDHARVAAHAVADGAEPAARDRHAPAVREVPAGVERHAQHRVAGLQERRVHREVRGRAGQRLDVRVLDAEQVPRPLRGECLDTVDDGVALVVALGRVPLRVLVREHGPGRGEHGGRDVVLGRDQAQRVVLALLLRGDQLGDAGVGGFEDGGHGHLRWIGFGAQARGGSEARRFPVVCSTRGASHDTHGEPYRTVGVHQPLELKQGNRRRRRQPCGVVIPGGCAGRKRADFLGCPWRHR